MSLFGPLCLRHFSNLGRISSKNLTYYLAAFSFRFPIQSARRDLAAGFLLSLLRITVISYTFLPTVAAWKSLLNPRVVSATAR